MHTAHRLPHTVHFDSEIVSRQGCKSPKSYLGPVFSLRLLKFSFFKLLFWILIYFGESNKAFGQLSNCFSPDATPTMLNECEQLDKYIPQPNDQIKTVKIAFHVMQRASPFAKDNFDENNPAHVAYLNGLVTRVNNLYAWCNVQWCNCAYQDGLIQERDTRIRFELTGIYYHRDNAGYVNGDGTFSNLYCYNNYATCKDEILNLFFCQIPDGTSGYGPKTHVMMFNYYGDYNQNGGDTWGPGNTLGHEFGHVFGLFHSWVDKYYYLDMCQSEGNGPNFCGSPQLDCTCGNNVMSYSNIADYFSPLQMAKMNLTLMTLPTSKYLKATNAGTPIVITQPTIWDYTRVCTSDVLIEPGASLTIKCKTIMASGTRIVTKRGARLIVDGARITTKGTTQSICSNTVNTDRWMGIEVWGNTAINNSEGMLNETYPLLTSDPGVVILKNGAIVEHAQVGIFAQQRGTPWSIQQQHFGGLISVNNAEFRDCRKSVEFISDVPINNSSVFKNCIFNQTFLGTTIANPVKTYEGVTSWQVSEILFDECTFNNLEKGIVFGNSTTTVLGSTFDKNKNAIEFGMIAPTANAKSYIGGDGKGKNTFKYCDQSIYAKSYGYLIVNNNYFEDCPTGVILEGTSIYKIVGNEFKNTNISGMPVFVVGIGLLQSGDASSNSIICNKYNAIGATTSLPLIRDGIYAGGNNKGTYFDKNKFGCWYDVRLSDLSYENVISKGVLPNQGGFGNVIFNEFTPFNLADHKAEIHTPNPTLGLTTIFSYFHQNGACGVSKLIPRKPILGTCAIAQNGFNFKNVGDVEIAPPICLFDPSDGILLPRDCRTIECLDNYYIWIEQKDALLRPGAAATLFTNIQTAPNSTTTVSALTGASPYLSEDVLVTVLNASMSETNKRNILAANIPLSPYIKTLAQQKLSATQFDYLQGLEQPGMSSLRDEAIGERTNLNNKKMALLRHLTDSLVNIGNISAADNLLALDPERFSREARVGLKLQTNDYTGVSQLLASYPTSTQEDVDFKFIQTINLNRINLNGNPATADSSTLFEIALSYSPQSGYAKTLAGVMYGATFTPVIPAPSTYPDFQQERNDQDVQKNDKKGFEVFPNPANETITIDIPDAQNTDQSEILIFDLNGKLQLRQIVTNNVLILDISQFQSGFYTISWAKDGKIQSSRYFIKTKI